MQAVSLIYFRRDLRVHDHAALAAAAACGLPLASVYIEPPLVQENAAESRRTAFIRQSLVDLQQNLAQHGIPLFVLSGVAENVLPEFAVRCRAAQVWCSEAYDAEAVAQETCLAARLIEHDIAFRAVSDAVALPKSALIQPNGEPFARFADYRRAWLAACPPLGAYRPFALPEDFGRQQQKLPEALRQIPPLPQRPSENGLQIVHGGEKAAGQALADFSQKLHAYPFARDFPALNGTSQLSPHLAYGTLSARFLLDWAQQNREKDGGMLLDSLIRREFAQQYAYHFPPRPSENETVPLNNTQTAALLRWQNGQTGWPLVDAAMRCLAKTGLLHHRLRRLAAQFFVHHLGIAPQHGEAWFAEQLLDYEPAANRLNWLSAAEAAYAPPTAQSQKLDPDGRFIRRHVPELAHLDKTRIHAPFAAPFSVDTHGYPPPLAKAV
ncbi:MAG: deoxyribodipyrimidine photo-lyase [Neisseria sp.]|nr:deoxyribodipyrimidine photo-lyase [Neisseria sp.]